MSWKLFSFRLGRMGVSKNPSFHTDFKNVHMMTLAKTAPKKFFPKTVFLWLSRRSSYHHMYGIFLKSVWKFGFLILNSTSQRKKVFISGTRSLFGNLKGQEWKKLHSISENFFFYKQILDFHYPYPFKIWCHTSKFWNFVKITGR